MVFKSRPGDLEDLERRARYAGEHPLDPRLLDRSELEAIRGRSRGSIYSAESVVAADLDRRALLDHIDALERSVPISKEVNGGQR